MAARRDGRWYIPLLAAIAVACGTPDGQVGPDFGKGGGTSSTVTVTAAAPSSATQDTTLDVQVNGSGFDRGSTVQFLIGGAPDARVRTNSNRYVSGTAVVANVTIAADALVSAYDVAVTTGSGKKGIGSDLFAVKGKVPPPPANPVIAYVSPAAGNTNGLSVMNVDGARNTVIYSAGSIVGPDWSPDGSHVVFGGGSSTMAFGTYMGDISVVNGTPQFSNVHLVFQQSSFNMPRWSPAGDQLLLVGSLTLNGLYKQAVFTIPSGGGTPRVWYTSDTNRRVRAAAWAPDGNSIAFNEQDDKTFDCWIRLIDVATGAVTTLYASSPAGPAPQSFMALDWSPDGTTIVLEGRSYAVADYNLYQVQAVAASTPTVLPRTSGARFPRWSPDGHRIIYQAGGIFAYDVTTGLSVNLARTGTYPSWRR